MWGCGGRIERTSVGPTNPVKAGITMVEGNGYRLQVVQHRLDDLVQIRTLVGLTTRQLTEFGRLIDREAELLVGA
jgi:hypothetical protein